MEYPVPAWKDLFKNRDEYTLEAVREKLARKAPDISSIDRLTIDNERLGKMAVRNDMDWEHALPDNIGTILIDPDDTFLPTARVIQHNPDTGGYAYLLTHNPRFQSQ